MCYQRHTATGVWDSILPDGGKDTPWTRILPIKVAFQVAIRSDITPQGASNPNKPLEGRDLKLVAFCWQASRGEDQVVWTYLQEAQNIGWDKAVPGAYSNWSTQ
jgi:hypothetical protein